MAHVPMAGCPWWDAPPTGNDHHPAYGVAFAAHTTQHMPLNSLITPGSHHSLLSVCVTWPASPQDPEIHDPAWRGRPAVCATAGCRGPDAQTEHLLTGEHGRCVGSVPGTAQSP